MAEYELNLRDYIRIFRKRKLLIFLSFLIFTFLGYYYSTHQAPIYQAVTTVKIEERKTIAGMLTEWITYSPGDIMQTQAKIIRGYPIMKKVALRLGLINEEAKIPEVNKVVEKLRSKIETERVGNTNIIRIIASSPDPEKAVVLANTVAQVYVEENLLEKNKQARTVRQFIEEQLSSLSRRLREAEDKVREYQEKVENIEVAEPIQKKLVDLEFQLASLLQKYTEKHPKVLQVKEQIKQLKFQIKGLSKEALEYARLKREVEVNKKLYALLKEKLEQARITEAEKVGDVSIVDPAVMPSSPINPKSNLGILVGAFMGLIIGGVLSFVMETLDTSIGRIEDVESITKLPVLGVVPSIEPEVKRKGILAKFFPPEKSEEEERFLRLLVHYKPASPVAEAFRNIRTNLKISEVRKLFLITSAQPQEGKTTILTNLALATAQEGLRTLLVGSDLRRPALAKTFGVPKEPGLSEVLSGTVDLASALKNVTDIILGEMEIEEVLKPSGLGNISILPAGTLPSNPAELLASKSLSSLIEEVRREFDVVFFDSPPVLPVTDASLLAPFLDGVILCYEIGRTARDALLRSKIQLDSVGANIIGTILNHTKPQTEPLEPYPYYYRYKHKYYKQEKPESKPKRFKFFR